MALEIMRDERVRSVEWKDLLPLTRWEVVNELLLPVPWIALSIYAFHLAGAVHPAWGLVALVGTFFFFLTGLRVVHNAHHYAMGIPRLAHEWVMFTLSVLMLGSMHAIQINHLHHHKHCMGDNDWEAMSARMKGWQAILLGPIFPAMLHYQAFKLGTKRQVRWVVADLVGNVAWIGLVFLVLPWFALKAFVVTMAVGQCFTAFFAVWTVHNNCDRSHFIGRTIRGRFKSLITYNMFYHVEHHLFPKVPTCHLPELARRLDACAPELQSKRVF